MYKFFFLTSENHPHVQVELPVIDYNKIMFLNGHNFLDHFFNSLLR